MTLFPHFDVRVFSPRARLSAVNPVSVLPTQMVFPPPFFLLLHPLLSSPYGVATTTEKTSKCLDFAICD
ncbi:unnamed protein product [Hymenolepis diminuta]|uniref:Uncharacterized protein n=1 Tax=Hymenolepis diminuta TaxID=6216 RepID=A0A0R3SG09_HYMDI|nr:unnamed protein product [Hymenolepis diminuta]